MTPHGKEVAFVEEYMSCAACVVVCPVGCLDCVDGKPEEVEERMDWEG